jgi:hypothetical protein
MIELIVMLSLFALFGFVIAPWLVKMEEEINK